MKSMRIIITAALSLAFATAEADIKFKVGIESGYQIYVGEHISPSNGDEATDEKVDDDYEHFTNYNPILPTEDEEYMHCIYGGVTGEILWRRERYGITTGLRYSQFIDSYDFDESATITTDAGEETITASSHLLQQTHYLGFPLEFRYLTSRPGRPCRFYFKMGSSWNFLMKTNNRLTVTDPTTGEESVSKPSSVGRDPDAFTGTLYPAIGFRIFKRFPLLNVEFQLPAFVINMPTSYFAYNIGAGVSISVQFPVNTKDYRITLPLDIPCIRIKSPKNKRSEWVQPRE